MQQWVSRSVWRRLFVVFCAIGLSAALQSAARADEASDAYSLSIGLYKAEKWVSAEEAFQKFVTKYPKHQRVPLARFYLGLTQVQNDKYADARKTLRSFVADYPQSPDATHARFRIAECSYYLDDFETAVTEFVQFEQAIKSNAKDPDYEAALTYLGDAQRRLKRYKEAIATFEKSLKLFPNGRLADEGRFGLAQSLEAAGQVDRAIELFRSISKDPKTPRADAAQLQLANLLFGKEQYQPAAEAYLRLEKDFPQSRLVPMALLNAGYSYYRLGQYANAQAVFDRADDTPNQAVTAGYWKGLSAKSLGNYSGAAEILSAVAKDIGKDPLAESVAYQLADCELRAGHYPEAEKAFLEVVSHWPTGQNADHSLYFATECVIEQASKLEGGDRDAKLKQAELLLDKFDRDYANSGIRLSHQLQRAQVAVLHGSEADLDQAEKLFQTVASQSQKPQTQNEARYRLARLRQTRGNRDGALEALRPLVDQILKTPDTGFTEALVLDAALSVEAGQFDAAVRSAEGYLRLKSNSSLSDQALGALAVAQANRKQWDKADAAYRQLTSEHGDSPLVPRTTQTVAETAYKQQDWDRAIRFFQSLAAADKSSPFHPAALSGLGWSQFQKGAYAESERHFRQFLKDHAEHDLAAEAAFLVGDSLQKAGKAAEAAQAFSDAFRNYQPSRHAFLAGLQAARIQAKLNQPKDADQAYAALDAAFPEATERDQLLSEWALVLYDAEEYERSDELFQKLVATFPDSELADNARFSLAESDLVSGRLDRAAKTFREIAESSRSDKMVQEDSLYRLVAIAVEQQAWKDVVSGFKELDSRFPQSRYRNETLLQFGNAHLNLNDLKSAESVLTEVSKLADDPQVKSAEWFPHVWALLAEAQIRQKKYSDVIKTAERARQVDPNSPVLYRVEEIVGRAYKNQTLFEEARQAFQRVISAPTGERTETACKAQLMIAETYFLQQNYTEARDAYFKVYAVYQYPEWQSAGLFQSGKCEELLNQPTEAVKTYKILTKEFPNSEYTAQAKERLAKLGEK